MKSCWADAVETHITAAIRRNSAVALPVVAALLLGGAVSGAAAQGLQPLKRISGPSPFDGCTADSVNTQAGTVYPETEIEPFIDANPANVRNLIAVWQQDRWDNGGARGNAGAYTTDGGATWRPTLPPNVTLCSGSGFVRASDPWISISPNGAAYFMSLAFDNDLPNGAFGRNAMVVNRSTNGGRTWSDPITLVEDPAGQILHDKNSLTADRTDSRFVYAVWDRLRDFTLPPGRAAASAGPRVKTTAGDGVAAARDRVQALRSMAARGQRAAEIFFEGPIFFARTVNGGRSWLPAREVYNPGGNAQTINNLIVVPPSGTVIDFFTEISPNGGLRIGLIKSFDKGASFRRPSYAAVIATVNGAVTPDTQELIRDASILFDVAVNPRNGHLYLVWQDIRFNGVDEVAFSMSTDGGERWSAPTKINRTPNNGNRLREQAIVPSIEVGPRGELVVTYYDFRFDRDNGREATDHWAVFCDPNRTNCRRRASWGEELRLTPRSFDLLQAPVARGYFLGDYMGLVTSGNRVFPAFGITEGEDLTGIYTRSIRFAGGAR